MDSLRGPCFQPLTLTVHRLGEGESHRPGSRPACNLKPMGWGSLVSLEDLRHMKKYTTQVDLLRKSIMRSCLILGSTNVAEIGQAYAGILHDYLHLFLLYWKQISVFLHVFLWMCRFAKPHWQRYPVLCHLCSNCCRRKRPKRPQLESAAAVGGAKLTSEKHKTRGLQYPFGLLPRMVERKLNTPIKMVTKRQQGGVNTGPIRPPFASL